MLDFLFFSFCKKVLLVPRLNFVTIVLLSNLFSVKGVLFLRNEKSNSKFTISKLYLVAFYNSQEQGKKRPAPPGGYRGPEEPFLSFLAVKSL